MPWLYQDYSRQPRRLPRPLSSAPTRPLRRPGGGGLTSTRITCASRRTKAALNVFATTFSDRFPAAQSY